MHDTSRIIRVALGPRAYDIHIGAGLLARAGALITELRPSRLLVLTHPVVQRLHGAALFDSFGDTPPEVVLVPSGERQKSLRRAALLYDELLSHRLDRQSVLVTFGGGVIGDLGGFVAATFMRGLRFVQIPTTLLAQVDASVGGKVAVDHPRAKNLIGAFYQPQLVIADTATLLTLPAREYRSGLAEVVKHGVIADGDLFSWMENSIAAINARTPEALQYMVYRSCEIKAAVVEEDERESGRRAILNFGHTIGHALESVTQYRQYRHGEAVAIGMVVAAHLSEVLGLCEDGLGERLARLLQALHLPARFPEISPDALLEAMQSDKKAVGGAVRFVLARELGRVEVVGSVPPTAVRDALRRTGVSEA